MTPPPRWPLLTGVAAAAVAAGPVQAQVWHFHEPHVLGASLDMAMVAHDPAVAFTAARAARTEIDRLDLLLSGWRADSELAALNSSSQLTVSDDLFEVIQAADSWRRRTGGAFDVRLGRAIQASRLSNQALDDRAGLARASQVRLDPASRSISRPAAVSFDLDGIAKGHVIDSALAAAGNAAPTLKGLMIDIGGDLRVWGEAPSASGWRIGVADPSRLQDNAKPIETLSLLNKAVAFSGPGLRDLPGGYSHILAADGDRRRRTSAAVVADTARDADALATALCALPAAQALSLADSMDGFEALVIDAEGRRLPSRGWAALTKPAPSPPRLIRAQASNPWPARFSLVINYEIPRKSERARSPYVAIWITDQTGGAVRTLTLLGDDDRFIDQNFIWWRRVGRASAGLDAIARPTRRPGRYAVVWDGRDDNGAAVGQGRFTVHIEASREHGTHGYQTFDMVLGGAPASASAGADNELGSAHVRYGPNR